MSDVVKEDDDWETVVVDHGGKPRPWWRWPTPPMFKKQPAAATTTKPPPPPPDIELVWRNVIGYLYKVLQLLYQYLSRHRLKHWSRTPPFISDEDVHMTRIRVPLHFVTFFFIVPVLVETGKLQRSESRRFGAVIPSRLHASSAVCWDQSFLRQRNDEKYRRFVKGGNYNKDKLFSYNLYKNYKFTVNELNTQLHALLEVACANVFCNIILNRLLTIDQLKAGLVDYGNNKLGM